MVARSWLLAWAFAAIAIAVAAVRPAATPGPQARDFEAYWSAGAARNAHADPYGRAIWLQERRIVGVDARRDEILPFVGPPATLLAWGAAARVSYRDAAHAWWAALALSLLALVATTLQGTRSSLRAPLFLGALALAIAFAPISSDFALGQLALPSFFGAAAVTVWAPRSPLGAALGACLAYAQPNAALGLASQLGRNRATLAIAAGAAMTYAAGAIAAGWSWPLSYGRTLAAHASAERFSAIQFGPASIAYGFGAAPTVAAAVGIAVAIAAVVTALLLARSISNRFARFAAFSALVPFVAGFFHEHDFVVAYAAAAWCAVRTRGAARLVALVGTVLVAIDWLGLAQRPSGIVQSALLATAAFAGFVALGENDRRPTIVAAAFLAIVFVACAGLAARHPVPIWPDGLAHFRAPNAAGPAAIWQAEQRASGLLAAVPAWALLRCLSLAGCALLSAAIYRHSTCHRTA